MSEVPQKVITSCKDCVFSEWAGLTQTGCKLGRIDKFDNNDVLELKTDDKTGEQYYTVHAFCSTCRNEEAAEKYGEDIEEAVRKEIEVPINVVIYQLKDFDTTEDDLYKTFISVLKSTLKPHKILVAINYNTNIKDIYETLFDLRNEYNDKVIFELVHVVNDERKFRTIIDDMVKKCKNKGGYYSIFKAGYEVKNDMFKKLDNAINDELMRIIMVKAVDEDLNGLTIQMMIHSIVYGNNTMPVEEKIIELAEEQDKKDMVVKWENLQ